MKSYVYEHVKLGDGRNMITRFTLTEYFWLTVIKLLAFIFIVWPAELLFIYPIRYLGKLILILLELVLRGIWWLIKLPWCLLFKKRIPEF